MKLAMAFPSSSKHILIIFLVVVFSFSFIQPIIPHPLKICKFDQIYQLGDSASDTGNLIREVPIGATSVCGRLPYGKTFFNNATGRCSNGLLMIDYIAMAAGLSILPPYKSIGATTSVDFKDGVNFAVAGSTALSIELLASKHILPGDTNSSLGVQLEWMSSHFNSICLDHRDCVEKLESALFMVGEAGWNDYNYAIFQGKTMDELRSMAPDIVNSVIDVAKRVIDLGAKRVVVPGNFPIGCLPLYKAVFHSNLSSPYDENQCLTQLNDFILMYHNEPLQEALHKLKQDKPNAIIVYGDYYNAYQFLYRFAKSHGFDTQKPCCGTGGKYKFNPTRRCGFPGIPVCPDPHRYLSWDGLHPTQEAYKIMAAWLLHDIFPNLHCHL